MSKELQEILGRFKSQVSRQGFELEHSKLRFEPPIIFTKQFRADLPLAIGAFTKVHNPGLVAWASIGRYTSIAPHVVLGGNEHPVSWLSTSAVFEAPELHGWNEIQDNTTVPIGSFYDLAVSQISIGNDVWIGDGAFVRNGVAIGDGAVIAARSVVTRDVPPYAIVGGNPARIIRMRFSEELIERLLNFRWWRFSANDISVVGVKEPAEALDRLQALEASGNISEYTPKMLIASSYKVD